MDDEQLGHELDTASPITMAGCRLDDIPGFRPGHMAFIHPKHDGVICRIDKSKIGPQKGRLLTVWARVVDAKTVVILTARESNPIEQAWYNHRNEHIVKPA